MKKLLGIFTLLSVTLTYASNQNHVNMIKNNANTIHEDASYVTMTTEQLQKEVEKRSINGNLTFDMGMELIKRWSKS